MCDCVILLFKQKTAYWIRMSGWSLDVCTSDLGRRLERDAELLDQQIVDRQLDPASAERLVEIAAQLEQRIEPDIDRQIDVRDRLLRLGEAAGDRLADIGELLLLVRNRIVVPHRLGLGGCRGRGWRGARGGGFEIGRITVC